MTLSQKFQECEASKWDKKVSFVTTNDGEKLTVSFTGRHSKDANRRRDHAFTVMMVFGKEFVPDSWK